jgi:hypothetical protein
VEKVISVRLNGDLLENKMELGGYTNISQFIRDLIQNYNSETLSQEIEVIRNKIDRIIETMYNKKIQEVKPIKKTNLKRPEKPNQIKNPPKSIPKKPIPKKQGVIKSVLPIIPKGKNESGKLAIEIRDIQNKLGNIQAMLNPVPKDELLRIKLRRMGIIREQEELSEAEIRERMDNQGIELEDLELNNIIRNEA